MTADWDTPNSYLTMLVSRKFFLEDIKSRNWSSRSITEMETMRAERIRLRHPCPPKFGSQPVVTRSENGKKSATNAADEKQKLRSKLWLSLIKTLLIASTIFPNSCALWRTFSHNSGKSVLEVKSPFGDGLRIRLWFLLECFLQNCKPKRTSQGDVFR